MKIVIINKSDNLGGAAVVSRRLMQALIDEGVDVKMLVMKASVKDDPNIVEYGDNFAGKYYFLAERIGIFLHNHYSRQNLFKVSTATHGFDLSSHPLVTDADVIILNWVNQGAVSMQGIEKICRLGKPVLWIMHDMWECTGICHHALECRRYKISCGKCQYLNSHKENDIAHRVHSAKYKLYTTSKIQFIAVSNWLAKKCEDSSLLENQSITVIPNAFFIDKFDFNFKNQIPNLPSDKKIIVMGAARLDDSIKGFPIMIEAMNKIAAERAKLAEKVHLLLYGSIKDSTLLDSIKLPFTYLGAVPTDMIPSIYASSHIVVSTSLYETLPGTIIEGAAAGCVPVTFGNGGQRDIVDHLSTGYIADYKSSSSIVDGIEWAVNNAPSREVLHNNIRDRFSATKVAKRFIALISSLNKNASL